jgi:Ni/Co efflux regulator RcnB
MKLTTIAAAACLALGLAVPAAAQPPGSDNERHEMRQDVRHERHEVRQDRRELRQDRHELRRDRHDMRSHNGWNRGHHYGWRNGRGHHCRTIYRHHRRVRVCR